MDRLGETGNRTICGCGQKRSDYTASYEGCCDERTAIPAVYAYKAKSFACHSKTRDGREAMKRNESSEGRKRGSENASLNRMLCYQLKHLQPDVYSV